MTREKRPVGWMVYGHPDGPGRFIPAPGRLAGVRDRIRRWAGKTFFTNGQAFMFAAFWAAAGLLEQITGWGHRGWQAAGIVIGATVIAALILRTRKRRP